VPHEQGFPGLEKELLGSCPSTAVERGGLLFVTQDGPQAATPSSTTSSARSAHAKLIESNEQETAANWKILVDSFLEGYHTAFTHRDTFYPVQYDNLTLVETLREESPDHLPVPQHREAPDVPPAERSDRRARAHLRLPPLPERRVVTLPEHIRMLVYEPQSVDRTRVFGYTLSAPSPRYQGRGRWNSKRASEFARRAGERTPRCRSRSSAAWRAAPTSSSCSRRYEGAVAHFHRNLQALIDGAQSAPSALSQR
jgi:hypothetical protein